MRGRPAARALVAVASLVGLGAATGACTHKKSADKRAAPELAGLAAVPATARVVIGADPRRLDGSVLVHRAVDQMLDREPELAGRVERLATACGVDVTTLDSIHIALTSQAPQPLVVATGKLAEADLAKCLQGTVGAGGGTVTAAPLDGRTLYTVTEGTRTVYFAFGRRDTVVVSASRDLVVAGLGTDKKVLDEPAMKALIDRADTKAPLWAAGTVDGTLGDRLLTLSGGKIAKPPTAYLGAIDPTAGLRIELGAVMASEDDAKAMESQLNPTLGLIAMAAQAKGLGPIAAKITGARAGDTVKFGISLTPDEVNEVLSKVDSRGPADEDAGPAPAVPVDAGAPGD